MKVRHTIRVLHVKRRQPGASSAERPAGEAEVPASITTGEGQLNSLRAPRTALMSRSQLAGFLKLRPPISCLSIVRTSK